MVLVIGGKGQGPGITFFDVFVLDTLLSDVFSEIWLSVTLTELWGEWQS